MSAIPNPYNPLEPVHDPTYFFGGAEVFAFFRQQLVGTAHERALVLIGRRGLGKSAVLRQLSYQIDEHYIPCIIPLATVDLSSEESLLRALVSEIRAALDQAGASTYRLPEWPTTAEESANPREWFRTTYLEVALAALRIRHLLLAFDDAHLLLDAIARGTLPKDWLRVLGDLLAAYDRLDIVCALDASYENQVLGLELLNDPTLHFRLTELALPDAERLVREPVAPLWTYAEGVVERILALAGGNPFLLHSICRLLFRRSEERSHTGPITDNDLTAIHVAALDQAGEILEPLWNTSTPNERLTMTALVRLDELEPEQPISFEMLYGWLTGAGYTINKTQLAAALRGLDYNGLVRADADHYRLPVCLAVDWVRTNAPSPTAANPEPERREWGRLIPVGGLLAAVLIVGIIGLAAWGNLLGGDEDNDQPLRPTMPTATLSLNIEATRQADFMTMTERARPTETPTITQTPTPTATATATDTPTPSPTASVTLTATATPTPTITITASPTVTPTPTRRAPATNTPRPTIVTEIPTLDPGA
ncbi:MAG: AAA family ATPase [Chloroflexi bacterium]|nr:AAA family ATPase [Chloroflexota bacterium]